MTTETAAAPAPSKAENGLGLGAYLSETLKVTTPTLAPPAVEKAPSAPNPEKEMGQKPAKAETKPEASPSTENKAAAKPDAKAEGEAKPAPTVDQLQKDLKKANDFAARERKRNDALESKLTSVETELKKLNGTHVEGKPKTSEEVAKEVALGERYAASLDAALALYSEDEVKALVLAEDAPYRELERADPAIAARVVNARLPVVEAVKVVKEAQTRAKYGNDPDTMRAKLTEELIANPPKELVDAIGKRLAGLPKKDTYEIPATLGDVRGVSREDSAKSAMPGIEKVMATAFPNFKQTAS